MQRKGISRYKGRVQYSFDEISDADGQPLWTVDTDSDERGVRRRVSLETLPSTQDDANVRDTLGFIEDTWADVWGTEDLADDSLELAKLPTNFDARSWLSVDTRSHHITTFADDAVTFNPSTNPSPDHSESNVSDAPRRAKRSGRNSSGRPQLNQPRARVQSASDQPPAAQSPATEFAPTDSRPQTSRRADSGRRSTPNAKASTRRDLGDEEGVDDWIERWLDDWTEPAAEIAGSDAADSIEDLDTADWLADPHAPHEASGPDRFENYRRYSDDVDDGDSKLARRYEPAAPSRPRRYRVLVAATVLLLIGGAAWAITARPGNRVEAQAATTVPPTTAPETNDLEAVTCQLDQVMIRLGDTGTSVECAQRALQAAGVYDGAISGTFDAATEVATRAFQQQYGLAVDGALGAQTATELGIWPGDDAFIVRTPPPAEGATDSWGMLLSSVATTGDDAPPLPPNAGQGTGKRVVYERASQRVWAIDGKERVVRSYLVTGSQYRNEVPGEHKVYSKSRMATGWDGKASLPYMVRYTKTVRGNIGFHAIPSWKSNGEKLQTEDELGQKLSGGCTRQAPLDAQFMWQFADIGTRVIVL